MWLIDWDMIEDRVRQPQIPYRVSGVKEALEDTIDQYRIDVHKNQPVYIEVWIEKDALSSIFYRETHPFGIRLMVNRWYSSLSAMYDASKRFQQFWDWKEKHILYFWDHDPSWKDMVRDVAERMRQFWVYDINVTNTALNMDQIDEYWPPENPAKITDPRAKRYIEQYGYSSWELDALDPHILSWLVHGAIEELIDWDLYVDACDLQEKQIKQLRKMLKNV